LADLKLKGLLKNFDDMKINNDFQAIPFSAGLSISTYSLNDPFIQTEYVKRTAKEK